MVRKESGTFRKIEAAKKDIESVLYEAEERFPEERSITGSRIRHLDRQTTMTLNRVDRQVGGIHNDLEAILDLRNLDTIDYAKWRPGGIRDNTIKLFRRRSVPSEVQDVVDKHDCELKRRDNQRFYMECPDRKEVNL